MTLTFFPPPLPLVIQAPPANDVQFPTPPNANLTDLPNVSYDLTQSIYDLRKLLPPTWFAQDDKVLDAILAGYADTINDIQVRNEWAYRQDRLNTATGIWLDMYAEEFFGVGGQFKDAGYMYRRLNEPDTFYRTRLQFELLAQRATKKGMIDMLTFWCGRQPLVIEPWNPIDTGVWDGYKFGWDEDGYWGSTDDPFTSFIIASRAGTVPLQMWNDETQSEFATHTQGQINGFAIPNTNYLFGAWDEGVIAWIGEDFNQSIVTDQMVYDVINRTKPAGTKAFVLLTDSQQLSNDPHAKRFDLLNYNFILDQSELADSNSVASRGGVQPTLGSFILGTSTLGEAVDPNSGPPVGYFNSYLDVNFVLDQSFLSAGGDDVSTGVPILYPTPGFLAGPDNGGAELLFTLGVSAPL